MDSKEIAEKAFKEVEKTKESVRKLASHPLGRKIIETIFKEADVENEKVAQARKVLDQALGTGGSGGRGQVNDALTLANSAVTALSLPIVGFQGYNHMKDIAKETTPPKDEDLQRALDANPKIQRQFNDDEVKKYFKSLAEHAPSFVKNDPHMTGKVLEQMLKFEGADIQTINKLLEAEGKMNQNRKGRIDPGGLTDSLETLNKVTKEGSESRNEEDDFDRLKTLLDER